MGVGRGWTREPPQCAAAYPRAWAGGNECIAVARDLWFEGPGFPQPAGACPGPRAVGPSMHLAPVGESAGNGLAADGIWSVAV